MKRYANIEGVMLHTYKAGEYVPDFRRSYPYETINAYYVDFGLAKYSADAASTQTENRGTEIYMAPVSLRPTITHHSSAYKLSRPHTRI